MCKVLEACRMTKEEIEALPATITPMQAADVTGLSKRQVQAMCKRGEIKAAMFGSRWHINKAALLEQIGL